MSEKFQKLQDLYDEVKNERDSLAKKANTIDRYKQKIEANQGLEKEVRDLRSQLEDVRQQAPLLETLKSQTTGQEMTIEKYRRTLANVEQDYSEIQTKMRQVELDNSSLMLRVQASQDQQAVIADLQRKLDELQAGDPPTNGTLESELASVNITDSVTTSPKIKHDSHSEAHNIMLQHSLDDAVAKIDRLERKYLEAHEKNILLEHQLRNMAPSTESAEYTSQPPDLRLSTYNANSFIAFGKLRELLSKAREELSSTKEKLSEVQAEYSLTKREFSRAQTDCKLCSLR